MPSSRSRGAPRIRLLTIAPSETADKDDVLTIYSKGTSLSYQLGKYSVGKEDAILETLKAFPPGSLVILWDSKGQSTSWTAETFALNQALNPSRCDVQFTQRCLLSSEGIASWWLRFVPSQFTSQHASVQFYPKAADSFGDPGDDQRLSANSQLLDLGADDFVLGGLTLLNDKNAPSPDQSFKFFSNSVSSEIDLSLSSSGKDGVYELRYRVAHNQPITATLGNGIDLKNESVNLWQPTRYFYTSNTYRSLPFFGVSGIRTKTMLACWNQNIAQRYLRSLAINQLFSALPLLNYSGSNVPWEVQFSLTDTQPLNTDGNDFTWIALDAEGPDQLAETTIALGNPGITARVRAVNLLAQDRNSTPILSGVSATLPMLLTQDGVPVKFDNLSLSTNRDSNNLGWQVSLAANASNGNVQTIRVGAFELDFPAAASSASSDNRFTINCSADYGVTAVSPARSPLIPQIIVAVESLPLVAVRPASEDDISVDQYSPLDQEIDPGSTGKPHEIQANLQRETAVVFSLGNSTVVTAGAPVRNWSLLYTEESMREKKQMVHMTLGYTAPADSIPSQHDESVLVLDRNPFTVAEVHFHPLSDTGGKFSVAEWSSRTGAWTIQQTADKPSYLLMPPQITGEEVVTDDNSYPQGIDDQKLPRLLLGSPTAVTYAPDNLRNFVEVPWNLRRLLTDQSLRVSRIDYEMLYGMACHTTAPQMRLTEAATLYGSIRPGLPSGPLDFDFVIDGDKESYLDTRLYWSRLYREYQSRLGIFVTEDPTNMKDPSDFRDSANTACELRLDDWKPRNDTVIDPYLTPSEVSHDYARPDFKGGALAGVNQPDIFTGIVSNRTADVGHAAVLDPRFSALGGFGTTQAMFDNDRSTLINTISMGRTTTYSVERIGRIGCFWNRAKHVIVYQRTVVPSRQFYLSQEKSKFAGRPLVRKVEEYVEFLQEERVFANESPAALSSYVKGFKCGEKKRFNVNSTWGSTVPGKGWKVPLWNPADASILPDVYPKPQLFVEVSTPEKTAGSSAEQPSYITRDCLLTQPQEVVFFTSTGANDTADTDKWAPVDTVDCVGYPLCVPDTSIYDDGNLGKIPLPEFSIPPGWESVSFTIDAPPTGIHVTDGIVQQNDSPLAANIKTITFSRGGASQTKTLAALGLDSSYGQGSTAIAAMQSGFSDLRALITSQPPSPPSDAVDAIKAKLDALKNDSTQLAQVATNLINKASTAATNSFQQAVQNLQNQFAANVTGAKNNAQKIIDAANSPSSLNQQWVTEFQRITDMIQSTATEATNWTPSNSRSQLDQAVQAWSAELEQSIGSISPLRSIALALGRAQQTIVTLQAAAAKISAQASAADIDSQLRPLVQQYSDLVSGLSRELAILRASVPTFDTSVVLQSLNVDSLQNQFDAVLQAASQSLLSGITVSLSQGLSAAKNGINQLATTLNVLTSNVSWAKVDLLSQASLIQQLYSATSLSDLQTKISRLAGKDLLASVVGADTSSIINANQQIVAQLSSSINTWMQSQSSGISQTLSNVGALTVDPAKLQALQNSLDQYSAAVAATAQAVDQNVRQQVASLYNAVAPTTSAVMQLVRAFGDPPQVPHLDVQPPAVAYVYDWAASKLPVTPILARANQIGQALNALGVSVPAIRLDQALVPPDLSKFDLNAIFSNFAGLNLKNLFSGIKLPSLSEQQFKVTHGWEPQARRAWLQADMNVPIPQRLVVFQAGALALCVTGSTFKATCRIQNDGTNVQQKINGSIGGTLSLEVGDSSSLINFLDAALNFDDSGKLQFQFNPAKIRLADALQAVSTLINTLSGDNKSGFTYGPTPNGVKCAFALPIPDTSALTSGISGLSFATSLELAALGDAFDITVTLGISSKNRPFNFAIFILGGCGYVQTGVTYHVSEGKFDALQLELAIGCSASLAIALGPISGGVYAQFGIELRNAGSGFRAAAFFQISGHVSLVGIVSIDIVLRLEASYAGGTMYASGHVEYEVKMFMFSISVSKDVSMTLGSGGQRSSLESYGPMRNQIAFLSEPDGSTRSVADAFAAADAPMTTTPAYRYVSMLN